MLVGYEGLTLMIMEAEKSQDLWSESWRPKNTNGMIQSESEGLGTRGANSINPSLKAGDMNKISQLK